MRFVANFIHFPAVKEFRISVYIWQSHSRNKNDTFLWPICCTTIRSVLQNNPKLFRQLGVTCSVIRRNAMSDSEQSSHSVDTREISKRSLHSTAFADMSCCMCSIAYMAFKAAAARQRSERMSRLTRHSALTHASTDPLGKRSSQKT